MFESRYNLWNLGSLFFLGLGVILPLIVTALFVARRLSPESRVRVGSLSIDQFASVVASFALGFFFLSAAEHFVPVMLVGLIGSLGLFAATVPARFIPFFAGDFLDRAESPAHVVARESAAPFRKPAAPKEPKAAKEPGSSALAGWSKRLTAGGLGGAGRGAGGVDAGSSAVPASGAQGSDRPFAGSTASHVPYGATPNGATPNGARQPTASQAGAMPAAAAATLGNAAGNNAAAATAAASVGAAAAAGRGSDASPATQAADVVPSASERTQAADVPAPAARESSSGQAAGAAPAATMLNPQVRSQEPIGATVDPASRPEEHEEQPVHEAFWFAVAQPRTAVDERTGMPAFVIEPGGWVLALEDRGHEFLVQHTDGRVGVLRDLSNIERG
jgi:hypothetical protein